MPLGSPASAARHRLALDPARDRHRDARRPWPSRRPPPSSASRRSRAASWTARCRSPRAPPPRATSSTSRALGVAARVGAVEAAGVGEQHQPVGADQDRHLRREEVVVAERDLVGGGRVVLVDHRQHAPAEQRLERVARVQVVRARRHVEEREQHLARTERRAPGAARRRRGRACPGPPPTRPGAPPSRSGASAAPSARMPARDRARGDDHHAVAGLVARGHLVAAARRARPRAARRRRRRRCSSRA